MAIYLYSLVEYFGKPKLALGFSYTVLFISTQYNIEHVWTINLLFYQSPFEIIYCQNNQVSSYYLVIDPNRLYAHGFDSIFTSLLEPRVGL